jgi:hypothetical protein
MLFYQNHEDEERQKKGSVMISIFWGDYRFTKNTLAEVTAGARLYNYAPMRVSVVHFLIGKTSGVAGYMIEIYLKLEDMEARARKKLHQGRAIGFAFFESRLARVSLLGFAFSFRGACGMDLQYLIPE